MVRPVRDPRAPLIRRLRASGADEAAVERARRVPLRWLREMVEAYHLVVVE